MTETKLRLVEFTKAFYIGGTEVQVVELLRGLPDTYALSVAVNDEVGPLLEDVWGLGYATHAFPLKGSFLSANTLLQVGRMARWLKKERIDLVHVHDFYATLIGVPAARLAGCKVLVGRLDLLHWHGPARSAMLGQLTRMADHVVANADAVKRFCVDNERIAPEKITIIRNGIDLPRFDRRFAEPLEAPIPELNGAPLAVHVANMSHEVKRQEDFLHAMAQAKGAAAAKLNTFFVGDGARRPMLERLAAELGLSQRAHFLGHRKDAPAIQALATFGVLSSNKEGLSNAIIEGMAARLPMLVTDVGGNPELIDPSRGLVVPAENPAALAQAIETLLADPAAAKQMGAAGRAFVERELTLEKLVDNHDRLYRAVIGSVANGEMATAA